MSSDFLKPNHTQIPNILLDKLMYRLPEAELRVLLYICRRTYGFQRQSDQISYSQFVSGIITKEGIRLDGGCGLERKATSKGLKTLIDCELVIKTENSKGNYYSINLEVDLLKVVSYLDQYRRDTKSSIPTIPEVVSLRYTQKKVPKEREIATDVAEVFVLKEEIQILDQNKRRDMQIIGGYLDYVFDRVEENITSKKQFNSFIKANLKIAKELSDAGYTDSQLAKAFDSVKRKYEGKVDWKLSTVHKELTS